MSAEVVFLLAASFAAILVGAELFTNGIEWFGRKLRLSDGAVGSVLAAVGTALPETMIPIIAIVVSGAADGGAIGVGAILGAPFMLATLAMFVTGAAVMVQARHRPDGDRMLVDTAVIGADVRTFFIAYLIAVGAAWLPAEPGWTRPIVAIVLVGIYARYVAAHLAADRGPGVVPARGAADPVAAADAVAEADEELAPLRFGRLDRGMGAPSGEPSFRAVNVQVGTALGLIIAGALGFVAAVEGISHAFGISEVLLALVIAPVATELPEKFNSVIWIRQGKDTLALGNITGAMVFQSTIPTVVALLLAPGAWVAGMGSYLAFASALIAFVSAAVVFLPMIRTGRLRGRGLLLGGGFYAGYLGLVGVAVAGG